MDLSPYVDHLRRDLAVAADTGGDEARALAERLSAALAPAARLMLLDALSAAADEITRELAPGTVEMRLRGGEPEFAVAAAPPEEAPLAPPPAAAETDDAATARISLRLSEQLKSEVERAAAREGLSVNAWLVRVASAAVAAAQVPRPRSGGPRHAGGAYTGWVR